jgi:hypothetical protein
MKIESGKQHSRPEKTSKVPPLHGFRPNVKAIAGIAVAMAMAFPGASFAGPEDPRPNIRVRVDNYTQASSGTIARAEREAARILSEAGLQTVWVDCPVGHSLSAAQDPCQEPLEPADLVLRILPNATGNKFQDTVFGFAVQPVLASVYYDYPARLARSDNAKSELHVVLGCVIAHELGHLLLGSNSHSSSGIMQPRWERKQVREAMTGGLLFNPAQAKSIQVERQKRTRLLAVPGNEPR